MSWDNMSSAEIDQELRVPLRNVRLIGELDLAPDSELYLLARAASERLIGARRFGSLARVCPAAIVIFLVAEGIYQYTGGGYWPYVTVRGIYGPADEGAVGRQFLRALDTLELETFEQVVQQEHSFRYVSPILLHGGIPRYCADDVWQLLLSEMAGGALDAEQLVAHWRARRSLLDVLDRPARRFIRFGGEFAIDLLQRMIDLAEIVAGVGRAAAAATGTSRLAEEVGLPNYLVETLLESRRAIRQVGPRVPRPRVLVDAYSGEGPSVMLPPVLDAAGADRWVVRGDRTRAFPASRRDARLVQLGRAPQWLVTYDSNRVSRSFTYAGLDRVPLYLFEENTGRLLRDQQRVLADDVLALAPKAMCFLDRVAGKSVREIEDLPVLTGSWSGCCLRHLDLRGLSQLSAELADPAAGETRQEVVQVASGRARPRIATEPVEGVLELEGRNVYSVVPSVELDPGESSLDSWRVRFRGRDREVFATLADFPRNGTLFDLTGLLPGSKVLVGDLHVAGPLGSDLRTSIAVVPGLAVERPPGILGPDEHVQVLVRGRGVIREGRGAGAVLDFPPGEDTAVLQVRDDEEKATLLVTVPRLLWFVKRAADAVAAFGRATVVVGLDEIEQAETLALHVRLRRTANVAIHLEVDGVVLQASDPERTGGLEGRWAFPLQPFATTAAHSGSARLALHIVADAVNVPAAEIVAEYVVSGVTFESEGDAAEDLTCCEISFIENRAFRGREVRLWPKNRPWEPPVIVPIDDEARGSFLFTVTNYLPAGPYLMEIALHDPWVAPRAPVAGAANCVLAVIGGAADRERHLAALDTNDPLSVLELLAAGRADPRWFPRLDFSSVLPEACTALVALHDEFGARAIANRAFDELGRLVCQAPERLARWLADEAVDEQKVLQLVIALLPDLLAAAPEERADRAYGRIWEVSVVAGAAVDRPSVGNLESASRWEYFTGWRPFVTGEPEDDLAQEDGLPSRCGPIDETVSRLDPDRLEGLSAVVKPAEVRPLLWGGYLDAVFALLSETWPTREVVSQWRSANAHLNDQRVRADPLYERYLQALAPPESAPAWCRFPQDLLAAAIHVTRRIGERAPARVALSAAATIAPALVERSVLLAIALGYLSGHLND